jgi:hypothetical protein
VTPATDTRADRHHASVANQHAQLRDTLKARQAELDRAIAHADRMDARYERRRSRDNERAMRDAWALRDALENELRQMAARFRALGRQLDGMRG